MIGKNIYSFDTLDSTNEYIKLHALELNNGDVILAKQQTEGKGRHGNIWKSLIGNLYFSFIIKKNMNRNQIFQYLMRASVATINTMKKLNILANIKYPNDIIVERKKIAGILMESSGYEMIEYLIIGIGINVNQIEFYDLASKALSIKNICLRTIEPRKILDIFIKSYNEIKYEKNIYSIYQKNLKFHRKTIKYNNKIYKIDTVMPNGLLHATNKDNDIFLDHNALSFSDIYRE